MKDANNIEASCEIYYWEQVFNRSCHTAEHNLYTLEIFYSESNLKKDVNFVFDWNMRTFFR